MKVLKPEIDKINEKHKKEKDPLKANTGKYEFIQK